MKVVHPPKLKPYNIRLTGIINENLIGFLAEHNFLPSAGIPTGLVEFNPGYDKYDKNRKLQSRHLSMAISEFAPGNQVVVNEWVLCPKWHTIKESVERIKKSIAAELPQVWTLKTNFW